MVLAILLEFEVPKVSWPPREILLPEALVMSRTVWFVVIAKVAPDEIEMEEELGMQEKLPPKLNVPPEIVVTPP